ncbi:MAG: type III pantothenate kinase [Candidatus Limnocylindrales bacterium]
MLIALNVGNSNINFSIVDDGEVVAIGHAPTPRHDIRAEIEAWIPVLLDEAPPAAQPRFEFVIASVVPAVTAAVRESVDTRGIALLVADETTIPIEIRVDNPGAVGDDRLVNAYAALRLHGAPAIIVDMGTATTFDVVAADGAFIGGAIAAGAGLGLDALGRGTAQLPHVPLVMPSSAIGINTVSAMQSGAVIGHSGLVHVLIRAITDELVAAGNPVPKVILTGGLSTTDWAQSIPSVDVIDPYLTLEGLARLHEEVGQPAAVRT